MKLLLKSTMAIAIFAMMVISLPACEKTTDESCEQQDMNEILNCGSEKNVEVCCETGAACVYKYNGIEYPDTNSGLSDLADALGCTYKSSANYDEQKQLIIKYLIVLKDRAWTGVN